MCEAAVHYKFRFNTASVSSAACPASPALAPCGLDIKKWTKKQCQGPMSCTSPLRTPPAVAEETEFRMNSAETLVVSCVCPPSLQSCAVCACIPPFIVLVFGLQRALNAELAVKGVLGSRADLITWKKLSEHTLASCKSCLPAPFWRAGNPVQRPQLESD